MQPYSPPDAVAARPATVVIIDDHDIVRFGLEMLVHACPLLRLAGSAVDVASGLRLIESTRPDLVISDMGTRDSHGLDTVRAVVAAQAPRPVLIVSMHDELLYGGQAIALGAKGYLMKESAHACVIPAALTVSGGGAWVSPRLKARLMGRLSKLAHPPVASDGTSLSAREFEVLELLKSGMSTKQIASAMQVSVRTVDIHRARIKRKLGLRTGAELIAFASSRL
jgi:DNA-binding NarL/FixJ family response regulator